MPAYVPQRQRFPPRPLFDLVQRGVGMFLQEGFARHHKTGRAKAALLRVVVDKGGHDGMQFVTVREAFDGHDLVPLRLDGEQVARVDRFAIHDHRASAADPAIAHFLGPGQVQMDSGEHRAA